MKKRIISGIAALALTFSGAGTALANIADLHFDVAASAAEVVNSGECGENVTWTLDDEGTLTISGSGKMTDFSDYNEASWASYSNKIKKVVIGDNVTSIGDLAFYGCSNLTEITIPNKVTSIGECAFMHCKVLESINIPDSVKTIGSKAFLDCRKLENLTLGKNIESLGEGAFYECQSIENITIPDGITTIDYATFGNCTSLASVNLPDSVTSIGDHAFSGCKSLKSIIIPKSVTYIGSDAFTNCTSLAGITIPKSVKIVGRRAVGYIHDETYIKNDDFNIYCCKGSAAEQYAIDNGINYKLIDETVSSYPKVIKVEWNEEFHQFRMKWNEVKGAEQYGIAVKIAGKWKVQAYTDKNYFTSPKLRQGSIVEMVVCAKVNGKWDTTNLNGRAFRVEVK